MGRCCWLMFERRGGAAAHWLLNFLLTYWFMSEVLPTPESPRMITLSSTFFREAIFGFSLKAAAKKG